MSKAFVTDARSNAAGSIIQNGQHYLFFAATYEFESLEGQHFKSAVDAKRAVLAHLATLDSKRAAAV